MDLRDVHSNDEITGHIRFGWLLMVLSAALLLVALARATGLGPAIEDANTVQVAVSLAGATAGDPTLERGSPDEPVQPSNGRLEVRLLGRFQLRQDGQDLTSALSDRPVLCFLWTYLLARAILYPGDRTTRLALADELAPGLPETEQRPRLRSLLYDLQHDVGPAIGGLVRLSGQQVGFDLEGCDLDVLRLAGSDTTPLGGLLGPDRLARLEALQEELGRGELLSRQYELALEG